MRYGQIPELFYKLNNREINNTMTVLAFYAVDEGSGLTIADSSGNGNDATLDVTIPTFWEGDPMVSQELGDADIAADALYFTDGLYHPVEKTQAEWVSDGVINYDKQRYLTDCDGKPPQLLIYKDPRTVAEDAAIKLFGCIGE